MTAAYIIDFILQKAIEAEHLSAEINMKVQTRCLDYL